MEFSLSRRSFSEALSIGGSLSSRKSLIPMLDYSLLEFRDGMLSVTSSDGDAMLSYEVCLDVSFDVSFLVSSSDLLKALKSLRDERVVCFLDEGTSLFRVLHERGELEFPVLLDVENYPRLSSSSSFGVSECIPFGLFSTFLHVASPFRSVDTLRPVMCGVYVSARGGILEVCATDMSRLFYDSSEVGCGDFEVIITEKVYRCLSPLLGSYEGDVILSVSDTHLDIRCDGFHLVSRLPEGRFPNFRPLLSQESLFSFSVDRSVLGEALSRASIFVPTSSMVTLSVGDGETLTLDAVDFELRHKCTEFIPADMKGEPISIAVKCDALSSGISAIPSNRVCLSLSSPVRPLVVTSEEHPSRLVLLMPMNPN